MHTHAVFYRTFKDKYHVELKEAKTVYFENATDALKFNDELKARGVDCCNRSVKGIRYVGIQDIPEICFDCPNYTENSYYYCDQTKMPECKKVIWVDNCTRWIDVNGDYGDIYINDNSP